MQNTKSKRKSNTKKNKYTTTTNRELTKSRNKNPDNKQNSYISKTNETLGLNVRIRSPNLSIADKKKY